MVDIQSHQHASRTAQQALAAELIQPLLQQRRPEQVLVLKHDVAGELRLAPVSPVQIIRLSTDETAENTVVHGRLCALPFEDAVFDLVVLQHLISDGSECVLQEALRVLALGGDIVICGLNSAGLRYRLGNGAERFPGLKLNKVTYQLKSRSFKLEHCLRMGLVGMSWPARKSDWFGDRWYGMAMPFADYVAMHCHHQSDIKNASVLRFKKAQRSRVRSTALDGVSSRKAAS